MMSRLGTGLLIVSIFALSGFAGAGERSEMVRIRQNHPGLVADLGVGLWAQPFPVDYDNDGDNDLLAATADVPYNGIYFFENLGGDPKDPVFRQGIRLGKAMHNLAISHFEGKWLLQSPENAYPDFRESAFGKPEPIPYKQEFYNGRDNQWKLYDYDGDSVLDLIAGVSDWRDYGWDNAFNEKGEWTRGPLHGYVYFMKNTGTNSEPKYASAVQLQADGKALDVYGAPSPNFADWDADGDLDLICGEFLDRLTYFENVGSRTEPRYAAGRFLSQTGEPIRLELEMLQVSGFDWEKDGDVDLIVGQEDGRVTWMENTGKLEERLPVFLPPRFFRQEAEFLKVGALSTPFATDWDADGDEDLVVGDTAGFVSFVENMDGGNPPKWALPVRLKAGGETIRIQAGPNGSIQGPAEAKWGYTVLNAADWDHDGLLDIVLNSIWGEVLWYKNVGKAGSPELAKAQPIEVAWDGPAPKPSWVWWTPKGNQLVTQWRTTPAIHDWNNDGLNDLIMLDTEGYLALFERKKVDSGLVLLPPKRIFEDENGNPLRLNEREAGKSGRRKFAIADWDADGRPDILIDSKNVDFIRNVSTPEHPNRFKNEGMVDSHKLAGHDTCPTTVDWDKDGVRDLLIGAEDGFFYFVPNPKDK